jgi:alpha-amylase
MNNLLLDMIKQYGPAFKVSFSLSGTVIDQIEKYTPDVLESFVKLAETGCVEFLAETYSHSLSALRSKDEFFRQVAAQKEKVVKYFGKEPTTFRNTELIYSDGIGEMVAKMGFKTMLTEGAKHILGWKSPNFMYCNAINPKLKVLLKNFMLSDDIAFRFSQQSWEGWPLTTEKYVDWLNQVDPVQETINLFMDYETFGEHQWPETGIFEFMRALPGRIFTHSNYSFSTPSELSEKMQPIAAVHVPHPISWADEERDLTAWLGNELQDDAFKQLYDLENKVLEVPDPQLQLDWKYLQTSDHFYYMCTKWFSDGDVHKYFNPYSTPYEAYINYMNVLSDFNIRINDMHPVNRVSITEDEISNTLVTNKKVSKINKVVKPSKVAKTKEAKQVVNNFTDLVLMKKTDLRIMTKNTDVKTLYDALVGVDAKTKRSLTIHMAKLQFKEFNHMQSTNIPVSESDAEIARKVILNKVKEILK